jgi:hypothetical protein
VCGVLSCLLGPRSAAAASLTILDMALARYNPDGTLDTGFAIDGTLTADFHGEGDFGQDVALDSAGRSSPPDTPETAATPTSRS